MRDHSHHVEVTRQKAVELLLAHSTFEPAVETVSLGEAYDRVLAVDVVAQLDMPNCLTCCMDSVAVHWVDFESGMPDTSSWRRGDQWEFANTGVGMPEGFDTAIVVEHVQLSDDELSIAFDAAPSRQFAGTRPAGGRMHKGDVLVPAGTRLTPLLVAHVASGNNTSVQVVARPKVAFIPTGNELVKADGSAELARGKNVESNSYLVAGKIRAWGGEPLVFNIVPDNPALIKEAVREACAQADIVVLNAGSSKGSDDWNVEMLEDMGQVLYHQTNHGPGHHSSGAVVDGTPVVGISGPPGGAAFTTDFYLKPLIAQFLGESPDPVHVAVCLAEEFPKGGPGGGKPKGPLHGEDRPLEAPLDVQFFGIKQMCVTQGADGVLEATPTPSGRPGPLEAESANAYYALDSSRPRPAVGDIIEVELRP